MSDWPQQVIASSSPGTISTVGINCVAAHQMMIQGAAGTGAVWPGASRAIYVPVLVSEFCTAYQMAFEVTTQSGNYDVGIYDEYGVRLVSKGTTAVPAAGLATADITDTPLVPGVYFLAMAIDNTTAAVYRHSIGTVASFTAAGIQNQASAFVLPNPATFATAISAYMPAMVVSVKATI